MIKNTFFTIAILSIFLLACKKKADTNTVEMAPLPADFKAFYESFHADSLYQLKHIHFPLQGLPTNADSATVASQRFYHEEKDWVMHHPVDFSTGEFSQKFAIVLPDKMIEEYIIKSDNTLGIQRRFAKIDNEWNLIYYVAPNRISIRKDTTSSN
jgi:hypothetical protein